MKWFAANVLTFLAYYSAFLFNESVKRIWQLCWVLGHECVRKLLCIVWKWLEGFDADVCKKSHGKLNIPNPFCSFAFKRC